MHDTSKIGSFMALRANGWSLAKISKELNISKSTLWEWDNKQQNEIHLLKHLQLEKLQEKYLPTYEEELSRLRTYLDRLELALENQDFGKMGPEYVLQMALQLRARLGRMREQVPLRNVQFNQPLTPLPFTGCVSRQNAHDFRDEYFAGESDEDTPDTKVPSEPRTSVSDPVPAQHINSSLSDDPHGSSRSASVHSVSSASSVVNPADANRTFPDKTPPGVENGSLQINGFHKPDPNGRPVLNSENGHVNGNGKPHVNGNHHPNGHAHSATPLSTRSSSGSSVLKNPELPDPVVNSDADPVNGSDNSLPELRDSVVNPPATQAGPFVPDGWELSDHVSETGVRLAFPKRKKP